MSLTQIQQLDVVRAHLEKLQQAKFYGEVTLHIQAGHILRVQDLKTTKLEDKLEELHDGNAGEETRSSGQRNQEEAVQQEQANQEGEEA